MLFMSDIYGINNFILLCIKSNIPNFYLIPALYKKCRDTCSIPSILKKVNLCDINVTNAGSNVCFKMLL